MTDDSGGGYVYVDLDEGAVPPGLHAVTEYVNNGDPSDPNNFVWTGSGGGKLKNCIRASVPDTGNAATGGWAVCDTDSHSGKRVKIELTGLGATDITFRSEASGGITEYYTYGKTWNKSGARIIGFETQIGTGSGENFVAMDQFDPQSAVLFDEDSYSRFRLSDGLFGEGGQGEGKPIGVGFFSDQGVIVENPADTTNRNIIATGENFITNTSHSGKFGSAVLDDSMVPEVFLWDLTNSGIADYYGMPDEYEMQIAWYDQSTDTWRYGNLGRDKITSPESKADPDDFADLDTRMAALADRLGVSVADLGTDGKSNGDDAVPADILAKMMQDDTFFRDVVEDLRNTNFNVILDVGDLPAGEFTLRIVPIHEKIVEDATSLYQFRVAGNLDGMANVPYLDIGNAAEYRDEIARINGLEAAERAEALERASFSFLGAFSGLGMSIGRDQVQAIGRPALDFSTGSMTLSTSGSDSWAMTENLRGRFSMRGSAAEYDTTASGIGYDVHSLGISAGVEASVAANTAFGVMVGGVDGEAEAYAGRGTIDASGWSMAAYGRTAFGDGGTVQGIIGYQDLSFDTDRASPGGVAKGKTDGSQLSVALQADYMFRQGALIWGPMASLEYYRLKVDGFDESGAGAWDLSVGRQKDAITLSSVGLRGEYALDPQSLTHAYGSLAYTHASGDDQLVGVGFIGLPDAALPVGGIGKNWADLTLGLSQTVSNMAGRTTEIGGEYRGSFSSDYTSHGLGVFVKLRF